MFVWLQKQKQTSQVGKRRKQSSDIEEDDTAEPSDATIGSQEDGQDGSVPKSESDREDEESQSEEEEDKRKAHTGTSKKTVKDDQSTPVKKTSNVKVAKSNEKTPKKSTSKKTVTDSTSASLSKSKQSASKKQKTVSENRDSKGKYAMKKQTDNSSKALVKDQGTIFLIAFGASCHSLLVAQKLFLEPKINFVRVILSNCPCEFSVKLTHCYYIQTSYIKPFNFIGFNFAIKYACFPLLFVLTHCILTPTAGKSNSSKKAKAEPSREDMHAVVVDMLKEVDFNTVSNVFLCHFMYCLNFISFFLIIFLKNIVLSLMQATLSDILRQLGMTFFTD